MDFEEFKHSIAADAPPAALPRPLLALWYDAKGDWQRAHEIAQEAESSAGSLVHAYLHRKEGDNSNARYWYSEAGESFPRSTLEEEWQTIAARLLKR